MNYEHLKLHFSKGLTAISKFFAVYGLSKGFQNHWKSEIWAWSNVTGTSYHWCHLITDVSDAIMHQLPNESTKLLNILFKNLGMVSHVQLYSRNIDTFWNSLLNDKSIWYRCIQDVNKKFASAINAK